MTSMNVRMVGNFSLYTTVSLIVLASRNIESKHIISVIKMEGCEMKTKLLLDLGNVGLCHDRQA